jgi:tetratricopeptide (TPR) repeat protein
MRAAFSQLVFVVMMGLFAGPASARQGANQTPPPPSGAPTGESSSKPAGQPPSGAPSGAPAGESSSKPPGQPPAVSPPAKPPTAKPDAAKPDAGAYDPVTAEDDIEVGTFYMHKGDIDAAISRFQDAIRARSNFAKPRLLLAEAYEKKNDKTTAVKYYKEYLQVYPKAPDAKKIQGRIDKLSGE